MLFRSVRIENNIKKLRPIHIVHRQCKGPCVVRLLLGLAENTSYVSSIQGGVVPVHRFPGDLQVHRLGGDLPIADLVHMESDSPIHFQPRGIAHKKQEAGRFRRHGLSLLCAVRQGVGDLRRQILGPRPAVSRQVHLEGEGVSAALNIRGLNKTQL